MKGSLDAEGWRALEFNSNRKLVLCSERREKEYWMDTLKSILEGDGSYQYKSRPASDRIIVRDTLLCHAFVIIPVSVNQWTWPDKTKGIVYDEVVISERAYELIEDPELLEDVWSRCRPEGSVKDNGLYYLLNNDPLARHLLNDLHSFTASCPAAKGFDFPPSMFRRCMTDYFEDWRNPTPEEFLLAITMEGLSGNTSREKEAIEAANLYVQNKGNSADKGIAQ